MWAHEVQWRPWTGNSQRIEVTGKQDSEWGQRTAGKDEIIVRTSRLKEGQTGGGGNGAASGFSLAPRKESLPSREHHFLGADWRSAPRCWDFLGVWRIGICTGSERWGSSGVEGSDVKEQVEWRTRRQQLPDLILWDTAQPCTWRGKPPNRASGWSEGHSVGDVCAVLISWLGVGDYILAAAWLRI